MLHLYDVNTQQRVHQITTKSITGIGKTGVEVHIEDELVGHSNRIYAAKFDPMNEYLVYSGGWDSYIVINDIRCKGEERVGEIFGPLIGGETIDLKGN